MTATVDVRAGSVRLPADTARRYFGGIEAVVLLVRDGALLVLPVRRMEQGGCLLKLRNAAGDGVVSAPDMFVAHGLEGRSAEGLPATWSMADAGLRVPLPQTWFTS